MRREKVTCLLSFSAEKVTCLLSFSAEKVTCLLTENSPKSQLACGKLPIRGTVAFRLYFQVAAHAPMALHHRAPYRHLPALSLSVSIRLVWIVPGRVWAASFRVGWSCFRCVGATPSPDRYAWPCGHPSRYCLSRPDSFKSVRPTLHSISVPRCPVFPGFGEGKTGHRKRRKLMAQTFTPRTTGLSEATLCNAGGQTNDFPQ